MPNVLSVWSEICGSPIASERNAVRKRDSEGTHFAATRRSQREFHVALADEANRQKRSGDGSLRKTFIITGILNLSTDAANQYSLEEIALLLVQDSEVSLQRPLGLRYTASNSFLLTGSRSTCYRID
jgi:hypothetical protein